MGPIRIVAVAAALLFLPQAARADNAAALAKMCEAANSAGAVDACTKLIAGGTLQAKFLAVAYFDRARAYAKLGDDAHAAADYLFAANHGHGPAAYYLAGDYYDGKGVERDPKKALQWYMAADKDGVKEAANEVAYQYDHAIGVEQNDAEAFKWYKKGADEGHALAQKNLAIFYEHGRGTAKDIAKAIHYYEIAAAAGVSGADNNLGQLYLNGTDVPKDFVAAAKWFRQGADAGSREAQTSMGFLYERGEGVPKDLGEAMKWYRTAADQGFAIAQVNVGVFYEVGSGGPVDKKEAAKWYAKAAAQGSENGITDLADLYAGDKSLAAAPADACQAFAAAADLAYRPAMLPFALCLESGEGADKDPAKAFAYVDMAARDDKKIPAADAERDKLAAQLSPEQKAAAAAFAADFKAKHPNASAG